jgi:hypothetical protein
VLSEELFPAGIPHPSPSPPGNYNEKKLGVGKQKWVPPFLVPVNPLTRFAIIGTSESRVYA